MGSHNLYSELHYENYYYRGKGEFIATSAILNSSRFVLTDNVRAAKPLMKPIAERGKNSAAGMGNIILRDSVC